MKNLLFCQRLFSERALETAVMLGTNQCLIFDAAKHMLAYRKPQWANSLRIFELSSYQDIMDKLQMLEDRGIEVPQGTYYIEWAANECRWSERLKECSAYENGGTTFVDLMGLTCKLSKNEYVSLLMEINSLIAKGSSVVFDYREESGEAFGDGYSYRELEGLLSECGFHIYEHVSSEEMRTQYLVMYNMVNKKTIIPPKNVCFCLAVKKIR